jgi:uncharacterized protein (TIGR03000 family)
MIKQLFAMGKLLFAAGKLYVLAAVAMIFIPTPGKAQLYDAFTVLRLPDRTVYFAPQGYLPAAAFFPTVFDAYPYRGWPASYPLASYPFAPGSINPMSFSPLSYDPTANSQPMLENSSISLRVPSSAEVLIQGKKMKETGTDRQFTLPPLDPQKTYDYDVRVTWSDNGRQISDTHHLKVRAGDQKSISYVAAVAKQQASSAGPVPIDNGKK